MIEAIIIEDEHIASKRLVQLVNDIAPYIKVAATIFSVEGAIKWFKENPPPDLIFLDIQLHDGYGFDILDAINEHPPIIFTTAYNEYAIRGFKYNGLDYLLKPIDKKELERSLEKFRNQFHVIRETEDVRVQGFKKMFNKEYKRRFMVKVGNHYSSLNVDDIYFFRSEGGTICIITGDGKSYPLEYSLDQLEDMLNPIDFFRINRKYMIALKSVIEIHHYFNSRLLLKLKPVQEEKIIVSRERCSAFKKWLDM
ncbi:LytTR family DNA-binding domain-containing protein [Muricauda oceani]|uniref:Response regulator transcription factor n=1 Tax=Flagellimonas oceani TaxID=2698672 RepID=A0A6G7IZB5_9FLAO|nr:LytTR family DNA-binding domain-containing protein [Allomuricauda oceani]MBW8244880.1 LytTR family DNA-binding domain-containing protein [Allomuricauda oceani]QII43542.1 response regulator transcription factor [Allomuricauda oceani]